MAMDSGDEETSFLLSDEGEAETRNKVKTVTDEKSYEQSFLQEQDFGAEREEENNSVSKVKRVKVLVLGQVLSLLLSSQGILSEYIVREGLNTPTFQSFLNYLLLLLIFFTILWRRGGIVDLLKTRGLQYFALAAVDVEANYVIVLAYRFTSLVSIQILDCFTIVFVMIMARGILKTHFAPFHYIGVSVCVLGMSGIITSDAINQASGNDTSIAWSLSTGNSSKQWQNPNEACLPSWKHFSCHSGFDSEETLWSENAKSKAYLGDSLVILSSFLYACSNIGQEYVVKERSAIEFLGMIGLFGSIISGMQTFLLERHQIIDADWNTALVLHLLGFSLSLVSLYMIVPVLLYMSSATVFNLSLLTSDVYTLLYSVFIFRYEFQWPYLISFAATWFGLLVYTATPEKKEVSTTQNHNQAIN
eukprot:m.139324 g.139324  ORF g.139324 m.139324 type:complete len:418 (+) comp14797_c0_seq3:278-1531(+)